MLQQIKQEFRQYLSNLIFMLIALLSLETYRSIILAQAGIDHFFHGYVHAVATAIVMAKAAVLAEKLSVFSKGTSLPLIIRVALAAFAMTALATLLHYVEDLVLHAGHLHSALAPQHSLLLTLTNSIALFVIFSLQLTLRCVDRYCGEGKLKHYFFSRT
jgi:hypothetical protein